MKSKILKNMSAVVGAAILITFFLMTILLHNQAREQMKEAVRDEAGYVKLALENTDKKELDEQLATVSNSRLTWIDKNGTVLYDSVSEVSEMENHASRPEVKEAMEIGSGDATRLSATLGEENFYYALRMSDGSVIRVARSTSSIFATMVNSIAPLAMIFILVMILAFIVNKYRIDKLIDPINQINLENPLENTTYEELSPLLKRLNNQNKTISLQMKILKEKQEEYFAITENMKDGLIVTNQSVILSMNKAAAELFNMKREDCVNKNILNMTRNETMKKCMDEALTGASADYTVVVEGRTYELIGNPVMADDSVQGAVLFILDITEKAQAEQMRREFSANVSHELKTPLMSISGYAELIMNQMVKPEDVANFAGRIFQEANRLSTLVGDIIKLSKLDEGSKSIAMEDVELWPLVTNVTWQFGQKAAEHQVQLKVEGEPATVRGNQQVISEMVGNLCDNAIKYNRENGNVVITVKKLPEGVKLSVQDNGIGIAKEEQDRIFERFYRIDKSHSKEIEGTGLGLSIVKHGAILHKAKIQVDSSANEGTCISVLFPNK